jgi:subtilisin family serine protease
LDFYAPGDWYRPYDVWGIYSSLPGGGYGYKYGTSMAAPHVTGAWAVIKSKVPSASVDFAYNILSSTGVLIGDDRSGGTVDDIPRIQLDAAIDSIFNIVMPLIQKNAVP